MTLLAIVEADLALITQVKNLCTALGIDHVYVARHTEEAVLYVKGVGIYSDRESFPQPSIVVLDSESPHAEDLEFMEWLRFHGPKRIPLVILTNIPTHNLKVHCLLDETTSIMPRKSLDELATYLVQMEIGFT